MGASSDDDREPTPMEQEDVEDDDEVEIDDDALEEDGSGGEESDESESEEGDAEEDEGDDEAAEEAEEAQRVAEFVADMPEEERARLKEVVWAQSQGFKHWPAFIYHPADVNDELRKTCYRGKGNEGPKTHHIVFYYNFGSNAFAGVPFKSILPWTPENKEALEKVVKQYKAKLPGAIEAAEGDIARPKDDRNPGPPDVKAIRKQEREARRAEREQQRRERQEQRRKEKEAAKRQRRAERKRKAREEGGAGGGKKKRKKEQGGGAAKAKAIFATETEEDRFKRLTRNLEILLGEAAENLNVAKICSTLDKLAAIHASMQLLTETGAGQLVKDLRRHDNADIQAKAKHTFATWKGSLAAPLASEPAAAAAAAEAAAAEAEEAKPPPKPKKEEPAAPTSSSKKPKAEEGKGKGKGKGRSKGKEKEEKAPHPPLKQELPAKPAGEGSAAAAPAAAAKPAAAVEKAGPASSEAAAAAKPPAAQNGSAAAVDSGSADKEGPAAPAAFGGGYDAFADMDEAKKRQRARSLLKQVLAGGTDEAAAPAAGDEAKLTAVAEQAEGLLFAHRKGRADDKYLTYVRGLCSAAKGNSHDLRARLLRGEVEPALADFLNKA